MIKKAEITRVLVDYGLSPIECDRATDSEIEFRAAIQDIIEKAQWEAKQGQTRKI